MDEVPMTFDLPPNRTVTEKNEKTVFIKTTGNEKTSFTVVLGCSASGIKLKPMIIFKRKTLPKDAITNDVIVQANDKGWMNEELMLFWLQEVYRKRSAAAFFHPKGLLVMDSMKAHLMDSVKAACKSQSAALAIIPGGLTKLVQPLDLVINRVFKCKVRQMWEKWMIEGLHSYTKSGKMRKATFAEVCSWVAKAWSEIEPATIAKAFEKAGLIDSAAKTTPGSKPSDNGEYSAANAKPDSRPKDTDATENASLTDKDGAGFSVREEIDDSSCEESDDGGLDDVHLKLFCSDTEDSDFEGFM